MTDRDNDLRAMGFFIDYTDLLCSTSGLRAVPSKIIKYEHIVQVEYDDHWYSIGNFRSKRKALVAIVQLTLYLEMSS